ncbi:MAG: dienelactone hydrolase family protein [Pseudomonadota bacterium]
MCDEQTETDNETVQKKGDAVDRRAFGHLSAAAIFATAFSASGCSSDDGKAGVTALGKDAARSVSGDGTPIMEQRVNITMSGAAGETGGVSDSVFFHPVDGTHPGILIWPDIRGLRPAFEAMGKRLATAGYGVLVVNPFWRDAPAPVVTPDEQFSDPDVRTRLVAMARKLTEPAAFADARDYIGFLDAQEAVDTDRMIGTAGYCMGGPLIMRTAGAEPARVGAAASFHGGGLVTDREDSPHLLIAQTRAQVLHAIAENDYERNPAFKPVLEKAYADADLAAEIEVYEGTLHGWCPPDSRVYNEAQAEKAWSRLLALYERAL